MDCVRSDKFFEHKFFFELAEKNLSFNNCIVQAPHTSTSHASILTGLYPFNHGVRYLIDFNTKGKMLQEYLKEDGFQTAAFIGGFPLLQGDLHRGFDHFEYGTFVKDHYEGRDRYIPANILIQKALEWMATKSSKDNFIFLHFFDAHLTKRSDFTSGRRTRRYMEEIDFMAQQIKLLLELADIDLLVITADHGDKLEGEHNYPWVINSRGEKAGSHFHEVELYDIQLKTPLIFCSKDIGAQRVESQVRSIDITPTILEFIGNKKGEKVDGKSLLREENLKAEYVYSETYFAQMTRENRHTYEMNQKFDWGWSGHDSLVSIRTEDWKLICTANGSIIPYMLFEKENEEKNIIENHPEIVEELKNKLFKIIEGDKQYEITSSGKIEDQEVIDRLKSLGYL